jgi:glutathione S-transferase
MLGSEVGWQHVLLLTIVTIAYFYQNPPSTFDFQYTVEPPTMMSSPRYRLHADPRATCARKVLLTLYETGNAENYQLEIMDLSKKPQKNPEYIQSKHPFGKIPVLEDLAVEGGFTVFESAAIIKYIAEVSGKDLIPGDARRRALQEQWISAIASYCKPATGPLYFENVLKARYGLGEPDRAVVEKTLPLAEDFLGALNRKLEGQDYFANTTSISLADLYALPELYNLEVAGYRSLIDKFPNLGAWYARMTQRESWKQVLELSKLL